MTKSQVSKILTDIGESEDNLTGFEGTKLRFINFSKYTNISINPETTQFLFNSSNSLVYVYPCINKDNEEIKYLLDDSGNKIFDIYAYDSIQEFVFMED